jgi:hypothetical protein
MGLFTGEIIARFSESVDRLPTCIDENEEVGLIASGLERAKLSEEEEKAAKRTIIQLQCEDYAGNFALPSMKKIQVGKDYYASKLCIYLFIIADMSRNRNFVYAYDERGMGKDANALCSLRLCHHMRFQNKSASALIQVMDNLVGQNKSQVVFMFFALLSLTLFPDGVTLFFLLPGHSHMAPDRVVSWLRKSIKGRDIFHPEGLIAAMNHSY